MDSDPEDFIHSFASPPPSCPSESESELDSNEPSFSEAEDYPLHLPPDTNYADRTEKLYGPLPCFSNQVKHDFHTMILSPTHTNRKRPSAAKYDLLWKFCKYPDMPTRNQLEANIKFAAKHFYTIKGNDVLFRLAKTRKERDKVVVPYWEAWTYITQVHAQNGHFGVQNTYNKIKSEYHGITRKEVAWVIKRCQTCLEKRSNRTLPPLQPITANIPWERIQIDLVSYANNPDGDYKYVLHIHDHFSKYSAAYPLKTKESQEVANRLGEWIGSFGPLEIVQCDNGGEFQDATLIVAKRHGIQIINSRPYHPQTNGLIERGNSVLKEKLQIWMDEYKTNKWRDGLPEVLLYLNGMWSTSTKKTAFEIVFRRKLPALPDRLSFLARQNITLSDLQATASHTVLQSDSATSFASCISETPESNLTVFSSTDSIFDEVRVNQNNASHRMVEARERTKRVEHFQVGDFVSLEVPPKMRPKNGGSRRIVCKIYNESSAKNQFQLQTTVGIIKRYFTAGLLDRIDNSAVAHLQFKSKKTYSLPKIARLLAVKKVQERTVQEGCSNVEVSGSLLSTIEVVNMDVNCVR
jgi:Integrase core domain/Integrase zinc binding domain